MIKENKVNNDIKNLDNEIITGLRGVIKDFPINRDMRKLIANRLENLEKLNLELKKRYENLINENKNIVNICYNTDETLKKVNESTIVKKHNLN